MSIPAVVFGVLVSTLVGAGFHLWKNGGIGRLILYILLAWIGFWAGHFIGQAIGWTFFSVGALRFGAALVGCVVVLGVGYWFSLMRQVN
jgi:hypothetical protein